MQKIVLVTKLFGVNWKQPQIMCKLIYFGSFGLLSLWHKTLISVVHLNESEVFSMLLGFCLFDIYTTYPFIHLKKSCLMRLCGWRLIYFVFSCNLVYAISLQQHTSKQCKLWGKLFSIVWQFVLFRALTQLSQVTVTIENMLNPQQFLVDCPKLIAGMSVSVYFVCDFELFYFKRSRSRWNALCLVPEGIIGSEVCTLVLSWYIINRL